MGQAQPDCTEDMKTVQVVPLGMVRARASDGCGVRWAIRRKEHRRLKGRRLESRLKARVAQRVGADIMTGRARGLGIVRVAQFSSGA